ncbi:MAG: dTDP-4-dehydrorhamnose reductase [Chthoniobacterales bacterium]
MKIAVLGSRGRLGAALVRKWKNSHEVHGFARPQFDLLDRKTIDRCLKEPFDWVVNCAANTNVDGCERQPEEARLANTVAARRIAERCAKSNARLIHISTDYVFDGRQQEPYDEDAPPSPLSIYGRTKADGEFDVLAALPKAIVARVSWIFGPEKPSFIDMMLSRAMADENVAAIADKWSTPSYTEDLADWLETLIAADAPAGVYHLSNSGSCSWRDYAEHALQCASEQGLPVKTTKVAPLALKDMEAFIAERPVNTVLSTKRFVDTVKIQPRPWQDAVRAYIAAHPPC